MTPREAPMPMPTFTRIGSLKAMSEDEACEGKEVTEGLVA